MKEKLIYIIEDDAIMSECISLAIRSSKDMVTGCIVETFSDALSAMTAISERIPDLIALDILLNGPNGFTLLNELATYQDTTRIPIIVISSLGFLVDDLRPYGVQCILNKEVMKPNDIQSAVRELL